jgi:hypothetical protein
MNFQKGTFPVVSWGNSDPITHKTGDRPPFRETALIGRWLGNDVPGPRAFRMQTQVRVILMQHTLQL